MKWYYWIALAVALLVAYELFSPKSTLKKSGSSSGSGTAGILNGAGVAAGGLAKLWDSVSSSWSSDNSGSDSVGIDDSADAGE
jgi:hypothetical protein